MSDLEPDEYLPGLEPDDLPAADPASTEASGNSIDEKMEQIAESLENWEEPVSHEKLNRWWNGLPDSDNRELLERYNAEHNKWRATAPTAQPLGETVAEWKDLELGTKISIQEGWNPYPERANADEGEDKDKDKPWADPDPQYEVTVTMPDGTQKTVDKKSLEFEKIPDADLPPEPPKISLPLKVLLLLLLLLLIASFIGWSNRGGESATRVAEQSTSDSSESSPDPVDPSSPDDTASASAQDTEGANASTDDGLPVLVDPCAVIDPERAATLLGAVVGEPAWSDEIDNARFGQESWNNCRYEVGSSTNLLLSFHINVVLSQRADQALADWLDYRHSRDATEIRPVAWAPDGELRALLQDPNLVGIDEEVYAFARLWATVIEGDEGAHDLYIEIYFQNVPGVSVAATADIVAEAGQIINNAILAAQP